MTKNIKFNADLRSSHLFWGVLLSEFVKLIPFLLLFAPALLYGSWLFGNLNKSIDREREFNRRVQECTSAQLREYGTTDSYVCKKFVNAEFRVYENL